MVVCLVTTIYRLKYPINLGFYWVRKEKNMVDVKYIVGEDWEGIYIHDTLGDEGHRIRFKDGFDFIFHLFLTLYKNNSFTNL